MSGFPFGAVVGQEETKLALLVAAVDAHIGGDTSSAMTVLRTALP